MFCAAFAGVGGWIDTGGPCAATAVAASAVSMLLNNHRDIVHSPVGLVKNQPAASRGAGPPASARLRVERPSARLAEAPEARRRQACCWGPLKTDHTHRCKRIANPSCAVSKGSET